MSSSWNACHQSSIFQTSDLIATIHGIFTRTLDLITTIPKHVHALTQINIQNHQSTLTQGLHQDQLPFYFNWLRHIYISVAIINYNDTSRSLNAGISHAFTHALGHRQPLDLIIVYDMTADARHAIPQQLTVDGKCYSCVYQCSSQLDLVFDWVAMARNSIVQKSNFLIYL